MSSIIDHKETGYVAKYKSEDDFLNGINWCLENFNNKENEINKKAIKKFNNDNITKDYLNFLKKLRKIITFLFFLYEIFKKKNN